MKQSFAALLLLAFFPAISSANISAISSATANSGLASVEVGDSVYMNPASLPHIQGYLFASSFSNGQTVAGSGLREQTLALSENLKDTLVPTAFSWTQRNYDAAELKDLTSQVIRLSVGGFFRRGLSGGISVEHQMDRGLGKSTSETNADVGLLYAVQRNLAFGVVANRLVPHRQETPAYLRSPRTGAFGINYNYREFARFKLDLVSGDEFNFGKSELRSGMEYYLNRWLVGRLGAGAALASSDRLYSLGIGFAGPSFGLHYAYQTAESSVQSEDRLTRHAVDLSIPLW